MKALLLSLTLVALFLADLPAQQILKESEAFPMEVGSRWENSIVIDPVETIIMDPIDNGLPSNSGSDCAGSYAASSSLPPGRYVVGITGGPGIKYSGLPPAVYSVAMAHQGHLYGGLEGMADPSDPRSYFIIDTEGTWFDFYITDDPCYDNVGYIEVTIAELSTPAPNCDDFEDGDYRGWIIESGTWDASGGSFCQSADVLGGAANTAINVTWQDGLQLAANTYLVEPLSYKGRTVIWSSNDQNSWIHMAYSGHLPGELDLRCFVNGEDVYSSTYIVSQEEWDGSDGLWHELKMQIVGNHLQGWRDDELLFETWDDRLLQMPNEGFVKLHTWGSHTCFDDICFTSVTQ